MNHEWASTSYNVLGMQHTMHVFSIWCVQEHEGVIAHLSHPGLKHQS